MKRSFDDWLTFEGGESHDGPCRFCGEHEDLDSDGYCERCNGRLAADRAMVAQAEPLDNMPFEDLERQPQLFQMAGVPDERGEVA